MESSLPDHSASPQPRLLLRHENRSGSVLRLTGDAASMLGFCHALRESVATTPPGEGTTNLRLEGITISADYDYHLSFLVTANLAPLLKNPPRRNRPSTMTMTIVWIALAAVAVTVLRGMARVFFGI